MIATGERSLGAVSLTQSGIASLLMIAYCYLLDRQISIRVGKAFWHRSEYQCPYPRRRLITLGPGMTYQHLHVDPAEDFPEMRDIPGVQDDYAGYLQCLVHITQVLSNAHDLLYPSKSRSAALAKAEHYYKHVDEFTESKKYTIIR